MKEASLDWPGVLLANLTDVFLQARVSEDVSVRGIGSIAASNAFKEVARDFAEATAKTNKKVSLEKKKELAKCFKVIFGDYLNKTAHHAAETKKKNVVVGYE